MGWAMRYERDLIAGHGVQRYCKAKGTRRELKQESARIDTTLCSNGAVASIIYIVVIGTGLVSRIRKMVLK